MWRMQVGEESDEVGLRREDALYDHSGVSA